MWFDIFYGIYKILEYSLDCILYLLRIVAPHTMKIIFVANLGIAYYLWFTLVEAQEFSRVADAALIHCQEALVCERQANEAMAEQAIQRFNEKQIKKFVIITMSLLFVLHWGLLILRLDFVNNRPPSTSPGGIPPGGALPGRNAGLPEEFVEVDPSVFVPEDPVSPVLEFVCKIIIFCLT